MSGSVSITVSTNPRPMKLMGHLEQVNLDALDPQKAVLDAYSISQTVPSMDHPKLQIMRARGIRVFRYINFLTRPLEGWVAGSPWFQWLWDFRPAGPLANTDGEKVIYPWFGQPTLWTWHKMWNEKRAQMRRKLKELLDPEDGIWGDLVYRQPPYWAFSTQGASYSDFNEVLWTAWQRAIVAFLDELRTVDGRLVVVNGDNLAPQPVFLERADWTIEATWDQHVNLWLMHPENVLSVFASSSKVEALIEVWKQHGGWISFTGDDTDVRVAMAKALAAREGQDSGQLRGFGEESMSVSGRVGLWNMCSGVHAQGAIV